MKKSVILFAILPIFLFSACGHTGSSSSLGASSSSQGSSFSFSTNSTSTISSSSLVTVSESSLSFTFTDMELEKEGENVLSASYLTENGEEVVMRFFNATENSDGSIHLTHGGYLTNQTPLNLISDIAFDANYSDEDFVYIKNSEYAIVDPVIGAQYCDGSEISLPPSPFVSLGVAVGEMDISSVTFTLESEESYLLPDKVDDLTFYALNDTHGAVSYEIDNVQPGISRLGNYLRREALASPDEVVISSVGDMWQGTADSNLTHGAIMVDWMNIVGFDAMAIGNHEFDWGVTYIEQNLLRSNFPFLGINIRDPEGNTPAWAAPSKIIQRGGWKIGVVGSIGDLEGSIAVSSLGGYSLLDTYQELSGEEAKRLKEEEDCDLVMILCHNGDYYVSSKYSSYIDLIFEGHTHQGYLYEDEYGIPHSQGWSNGDGMNYLHFVREGDSLVYSDGEEINGYSLCAESEDTATNHLISNYSSIIDPIKNEVLSESCPGLSRSQIANESTASMLTFYQEKYERSYEISAAFVNSGCARNSLPSGRVTYGDLYQALPFDNDNVLCSVSGQGLQLLLQDGYCVSAAEGDLNSWNVDLSKTYYVIVLSYVSEQSSYSYLEEIERDSQNRQRDIYADAIRSGEVNW